MPSPDVGKSAVGQLPLAYPAKLAALEAAAIEKRRKAANPASGEARAGENGLPVDTVGVALSGGGIRSATFCLGVFRALARHDLLRRVDVLSTVSGGGYFGSFLGGLFLPRPPTPPRPRADEVRQTLLSLRSGPVDWLRENGRYMSPNGAGDTLLAGAIALRNWVAVLLVVSTFLLTLFAGAAWLATQAEGWWGGARVSPWLVDLDGAIPWDAVSFARLHVRLSTYFALPIVLLLVFVLPLGWAFWFTQPWGLRGRKTRVPPWVFALALAAAVLGSGSFGAVWGQVLVLESAAAVAWWLTAVALSRIRAGAGARTERLERNHLSRWLSKGLWAAVLLFLFALVDTVGHTVATPGASQPLGRLLASAGAALLAVFAGAQKALPYLGSLGGEKRLALRPALLYGLVAAVVSAGLLVGVSALAHVAGPAGEATVALCALGATVALAWTIPFLNLSSLNSLYGARLTRAYLGASNTKRQAEQATITELIPGDQISLADYDPAATGGSLHLVNVTLNETVSGKSQLEQRDRKGLALAVGPCGISVGRRHHALWKEGERGRAVESVSPGDQADYQVFPVAGPALQVEELDLGAWVSISGAAFTTGLGARTSMSLSLLLGLGNVRLGHWWDSGVNPADRRLAGQPVREPLAQRLGRWFAEGLPVHAYLLDELLARFHGPARRRWYLSDGGHFENTAAYELIRRRLPFIVMCDCGCDPDYSFADLANLARRVRLDFDAELAVFTREHLDAVLPWELRGSFGVIEDFAADAARPRPHALLAGVFYEDPMRERDPGSVLLILKPALSGDEPPDVSEYRAAHERFPQEPTSDQFFDEAQWESYRRLGEHVASRVFEDLGAGRWRPLDLCSPPVSGLDWRGAGAKPGDTRGTA
jgi:hypothetical protein